MLRKRGWPWLMLIALGATLICRNLPAQTTPLPPAIEDRPLASVVAARCTV